jgi:anti-sigma B factor antagonist
MDLRLRSRTVGNVVVVEIGGEIDLHSAPGLRAELMRLGEVPLPRLVIDLREVSFLDSTGIGVLVGALKRARDRGGSVHFSACQSRVKRVFEITGLMRALPLFDTREEAIAAFNSPPAASTSTPPADEATASASAGAGESP